MSRKQRSTILSSPGQQGKGKHQPTSPVGQQYFPLFFGGSYSTVQVFNLINNLIPTCAVRF